QIDAWTKICQSKVGRNDWYPYNFEKVTGGLLCIGAVCPLITRGKNKGEPNFRKKQKHSIDKVYISQKELKDNG
ncbi:MAG: hypothetical protein DI598_20815, partial [Pseudopedobacter saltans]